MPKSLNRVEILGNCGKLPEVKYTQQGTPVAKFSVACNYSVKNNQGGYDERTEWINVVAWQKLAEIVGEYLHKGDKVYVEGRMQTRSWDDKGGNKHYTTEVVAQDVILIGGRRESQEDTEPRQQSQPRSARDPREGTTVTAENPITDDDIPF